MVTTTDPTPAAEESMCGTVAGYQRHRSAGKTTCPQCRRAQADRVARSRDEHGRANPDRERRWARARGRAITALAREYPERYRELLHEQLLAAEQAMTTVKGK
jgi:hypothetical protein